MYVRWLDEIEDFRFDVTHLPGSRNPRDPLSESRRGFADGDGPAASTGDAADTESQQELFSRPSRGWAATPRAGECGRRPRPVDSHPTRCGGD